MKLQIQLQSPDGLSCLSKIYADVHEDRAFDHIIEALEWANNERDHYVINQWFMKECDEFEEDTVWIKETLEINGYSVPSDFKGIDDLEDDACDFIYRIINSIAHENINQTLSQSSYTDEDEQRLLKYLDIEPGIPAISDDEGDAIAVTTIKYHNTDKVIMIQTNNGKNKTFLCTDYFSDDEYGAIGMSMFPLLVPYGVPQALLISQENNKFTNSLQVPVLVIRNDGQLDLLDANGEIIESLDKWWLGFTGHKNPRIGFLVRTVELFTRFNAGVIRPEIMVNMITGLFDPKLKLFDKEAKRQLLNAATFLTPSLECAVNNIELEDCEESDAIWNVADLFIQRMGEMPPSKVRGLAIARVAGKISQFTDQWMDSLENIKQGKNYCRITRLFARAGILEDPAIDVEVKIYIALMLFRTREISPRLIQSILPGLPYLIDGVVKNPHLLTNRHAGQLDRLLIDLIEHASINTVHEIMRQHIFKTIMKNLDYRDARALEGVAWLYMVLITRVANTAPEHPLMHLQRPITKILIERMTSPSNHNATPMGRILAMLITLYVSWLPPEDVQSALIQLRAAAGQVTFWLREQDGGIAVPWPTLHLKHWQVQNLVLAMALGIEFNEGVVKLAEIFTMQIPDSYPARCIRLLPERLQMGLALTLKDGVNRPDVKRKAAQLLSVWYHLESNPEKETVAA